MAWNGHVYPITHGVEAELTSIGSEHGMQQLPAAVRMMVDALGEYEHGTADVEDVMPEVFDRITSRDLKLAMSTAEQDEVRDSARQVLLRAYAAVTQDLALTIMMQS